jgi:hypothetical protein
VVGGRVTGRLTGRWPFAAVIWAAGAGREDCRLFKDPRATNPDPLYEGRAFWSRDPFSQTDTGVLGKAARVLISGGGDGGLQDYLRVVTRYETAEALYRDCNISQEIADRIQSAEDRAHRGRIWVNEDRAHRADLERPYLRELQQAHQAAVEDALSVTAVNQSLEDLFDLNPPHTVLAYREPYFTNYYGLNRFLVLLVARFLERKNPGFRILRPQTVITDVSPAATDAHTCMVTVGGDWEPAGGYATPICHGRDHDVTFRDQAGTTTTETFNVIVVRYGARDHSTPLPPLPLGYLKKLPLARPRHLLPYHQPV